MSPPGGEIGCFVFDSRHPGVTLAGSTGGLIYRSTDGGVSWTILRVGSAAEEFSVIGQSPAADGVFYAFSTGLALGTVWGTGRVYESQDDGLTWTALARQPPAVGGYGRGLGRGIAIDQTGRIIVLSDHFGGIYRSTDAGESWKVAVSGITTRPYGLAVDPTRANTLWAAGYTRHPTTAVILKSTDFGATWKTSHPAVLNAGLSAPFADAIAVQPGTGSVFATYESTDPSSGLVKAGVARSTDGGANWTVSNTGILADFGLGSASGGIVFDPATPGTIYLSTNSHGLPDGGGVYRSTDSGRSWTPIGLHVPSGGAFVAAARPAMPSFPAAVFVGTPDIAVSTDSGASWAARNGGFANAQITQVAGDGSAVGYYGITGSALFHSTHPGLGWTAAKRWLGSQSPMSLAVDRTRPVPPVYLATVTDLLRSANGGKTWTSVQPKLSAGLSIGTVVTDSEGSVFAADTGHTLYRSIDMGAHWTAEPLGAAGDVFGATPVVFAGALSGTGSGLGYANLNSGLWVSSDEGVTWGPAPVQPAGAVLNMAIQHASPFALFVSSGAGTTLKYVPGDTSFSDVTANAPTGGLLVAAPAGNAVFDVLTTSSIFASTDDFATSSNVAAPLSGLDGHYATRASATDTALFVSDMNGSTFMLPYSALPH